MFSAPERTMAEAGKRRLSQTLPGQAPWLSEKTGAGRSVLSCFPEPPCVLRQPCAEAVWPPVWTPQARSESPCAGPTARSASSSPNPSSLRGQRNDPVGGWSVSPPPHRYQHLTCVSARRATRPCIAPATGSGCRIADSAKARFCLMGSGVSEPGTAATGLTGP